MKHAVHRTLLKAVEILNYTLAHGCLKVLARLCFRSDIIYYTLLM